MTDTRTCEQCGTPFTPRREHARFCSARCRVAWNRQHASDPPGQAGALDWSVSAMRETVGRLMHAPATDRAHAFAVITEAVWWVTMVDATLVRYHQDAYDGVLSSTAARPVIEGTFSGLRFVRNQMGFHLDPADFLRPAAAGPGPIAAWAWQPVPEPGVAALPARGQEWELARYRDYQARLAARPVGEAFGRAADFLGPVWQARLAPARGAS
jgi:hypothetical protein